MSRSCGECSACCFTLEVKAIKKRPFSLCGSLSESGGCSIYPDRPDVCRTFTCAWLSGEVGTESQRPDMIGLVSVKRDGRIFVFKTREGVETEVEARQFLASLYETKAGTYLYPDLYILKKRPESLLL